ncbi:MAG: ABC transporter substrate-binding protein [Roseiflexaceae bacterium]
MGEKPTRLSRRQFLQGSAAVVSAAVLAACGAGNVPAVAPTAPAAPAAATVDASAPSPAPAAPTAAAAPAGAASTFASQIDTAGIKKGGTIIEGSTLDVRILNPILTSDTASSRVINLIFDGLVNVDPDTLDPIPNLATKWEAAPDGKSYTFTLKQGVKWHDGQPFTADDVKLTYDLLMDAKSGTPRAGTLTKHIDSVEVKDPMTVVFKLKDVIASFMVNDAGFGIVPKHILGQVKPEDIPTHEFSTAKPIGTGPFKFQEFLKGDHVTVTANPDHHRGAPAIDSYIRKFVKDDTALYQQLKTGEVDYFENLPTDFYDDAKSQDSFSVSVFDGFNFQFFGYNLDPAKVLAPFKDVKVRQALFYAVDREGIVKTIRNGLSTIAQGTMPVLSWAYQPDKMTVRYEYDPDKAKQMLDEAGWKAGADGVREKDGQKLAFTLNTFSGNKTIDGIVSVFQQNWKDIGVAMTPQSEEFSAFVTRLTKTFDFQTFLVGFFWGVDPDQQTMWDSKQHGPGFNLYDYSNPKVDELFEQALHTLDKEKRKDLYVQVQNLILADAPALIIDFPKNLSGVNKRVKNLIPNAVNVPVNSYQWYVTDGK